ncbi:MAG: hypothetical protein M3R00_10760, partial [Pseudomonadota bacterium]|nr:hypothetical protein [Pseudomonadota bacterium]
HGLRVGLTQENLGLMLINLAANPANKTIRGFVTTHTHSVNVFLKNLLGKPHICQQLTDDALLLLFTIASEGNEDIFESLCKSPELMHRLLALRNEGKIDFTLDNHIKILLKLMLSGEQQFKHCYENTIVQNDIKALIAKLFISKDLTDKNLLISMHKSSILRPLLFTHQDPERIYWMVTNLYTNFDDNELVSLRADNKPLWDRFIKTYGADINVVRILWEGYCHNADVFKEALRYRGDVDTYLALLTPSKWDFSDTFVKRMMEAKEALDIESFIKDIANIENGAKLKALFKANPNFAQAVAADAQLNALVPTSPRETQASLPWMLDSFHRRSATSSVAEHPVQPEDDECRETRAPSMINL